MGGSGFAPSVANMSIIFLVFNLKFLNLLLTLDGHILIETHGSQMRCLTHQRRKNLVYFSNAILKISIKLIDILQVLQKMIQLFLERNINIYILKTVHNIEYMGKPFSSQKKEKNILVLSVSQLKTIEIYYYMHKHVIYK